ncbi:MAG: bifunctional 2-polyprenyl-6-hydroxyphenol methylase/3-demethylubiquinol 3-O-methyltransferase UbiG, partial [Methylophaga sp.]
IKDRTFLKAAKIVDVGCGGGILTESLALSGADATGVDMGELPLEIARLHALEAGLKINYQQTTAEAMAANHPDEFDAVTCMEMLEHVPDPQPIITACAQMVKPGGDVYFSTLNRNPKAWLLAIVGAEYIANMLPKGTHDYARFIKPSELACACREAGLTVTAIAGISYHPLTRKYALTQDVDVNYLIHCRRL